MTEDVLGPLVLSGGAKLKDTVEIVKLQAVDLDGDGIQDDAVGCVKIGNMTPALACFVLNHDAKDQVSLKLYNWKFESLTASNFADLRMYSYEGIEKRTLSLLTGNFLSSPGEEVMLFDGEGSIVKGMKDLFSEK